MNVRRPVAPKIADKSSGFTLSTELTPIRVARGMAVAH